MRFSISTIDFILNKDSINQMDLVFTIMLRIKTNICREINESKIKEKALVCRSYSLLSKLHPQKEPVLVSNFSFDLGRNPNPKTLPTCTSLSTFIDFYHCFQLVMVCILSFWIISLSLEF